MTKEQLYEIIGDINEAHVEAANKRRPKKHAWMKWVAAAACLSIVAGGLYCYKLENPYPKKEVYSGQPVPSMEEGGTKDAYLVPDWEEREMYSKYPEVIWTDVRYNVRAGVFEEARLGARLLDGTAESMAETSIETGEEVIRTCGITLYEIAGISTECAVAVRYEGEEVCHAAVNYMYYPQTLEQFIADLNLQENLFFGTAYYSYRKPISGEYTTVQFENIGDEKIWELLLANSQAQNVYSEELLKQKQPEKLLSISIGIPVLGYKNISLSIMDQGYIMTNILDTGKLFYVGEEYTVAFVEYVLKECEGYEIIHVYNDADAKEESATETAPSGTPEKYIIEE